MPVDLGSVLLSTGLDTAGYQRDKAALLNDVRSLPPLSLQVRLDPASLTRINTDLKNLSARASVLDLKARLDPASLSALTKQLSSLGSQQIKVSINAQMAPNVALQGKFDAKQLQLALDTAGGKLKPLAVAGSFDTKALQQQLSSVTQGLKSVSIPASINNQQYSSSLKQAESETRTVTDHIAGFFGDLRKIGYTVFAAEQIGNFGKGVLNWLTESNRQFELWQNSYAFYLKDTQAAQQRMVEVQQLASTSAFKTDDLMQADLRLTQMGIHSERLVKDMIDLGAAVKGQLSDPLETITNIFAQMRAGNFGRAFGAQGLGRFGISPQDLQAVGLQFDGKKYVGSVSDAFTGVEKIIETKFQGISATQAKSLSGMMTNIGDFAEYTKVKLADPFTFLAEKLLAPLADPQKGIIGKDSYFHNLETFRQDLFEVFSVATGIIQTTFAEGGRAAGAFFDQLRAGGPALAVIAGGLAAITAVKLGGWIADAGGLVGFLSSIAGAAAVPATLLAVAAAAGIVATQTKDGKASWDALVSKVSGDRQVWQGVAADFGLAAQGFKVLLYDLAAGDMGRVQKDMLGIGQALLLGLAQAGVGIAQDVLPGLLQFSAVVVAHMASLAADAAQWGINIAASWVSGFVTFLVGEGEALLAGVLAWIGQLFEGHSPPTRGPLKDIKVWGQAVSQAWLDGFTDPDFSVLSTLTTQIKSRLQGLVDVGQLDQTALIPRLLGDRNAIEQAIELYRDGFETIDQAVQRLRSSLDGEGPEIQAMAEALLHVADLDNQIHDLNQKIQSDDEKIKAIRETEDPYKLQIDGLKALTDQNDAYTESIKAQEDVIGAAYDDRLDKLHEEKDALTAQIDLVNARYDAEIKGLEDAKRLLTDKMSLADAEAKQQIDQNDVEVARLTLADDQTKLNNLLGGRDDQGKALKTAPSALQIAQARASVLRAQNELAKAQLRVAPDQVAANQLGVQAAGLQIQKDQALAPLETQRLQNEAATAQVNADKTRALEPLQQQLLVLQQHGRELKANKDLLQSHVDLIEASAEPLIQEKQRLSDQKQVLTDQKQQYDDIIKKAGDRLGAENDTFSLLKQQADLLKNLDAQNATKKGAAGPAGFNPVGALDTADLLTPNKGDLPQVHLDFDMTAARAQVDAAFKQIGADFSTRIGKLGDQFKTDLEADLRKAFDGPGGAGMSIGGMLGEAIVGGMVAGLPGAIMGALVGPIFIESLKKAIAAQGSKEDQAGIALTAIGGAGVGGAIGLAIGGPIGAAIGAAIGEQLGIALGSWIEQNRDRIGNKLANFFYDITPDPLKGLLTKPIPESQFNASPAQRDLYSGQAVTGAAANRSQAAFQAGDFPQGPTPAPTPKPPVARNALGLPVAQPTPNNVLTRTASGVPVAVAQPTPAPSATPAYQGPLSEPLQQPAPSIYGPLTPREQAGPPPPEQGSTQGPPQTLIQGPNKAPTPVGLKLPNTGMGGMSDQLDAAAASQMADAAAASLQKLSAAVDGDNSAIDGLLSKLGELEHLLAGMSTDDALGRLGRDALVSEGQIATFADQSLGHLKDLQDGLRTADNEGEDLFSNLGSGASETATRLSGDFFSPLMASLLAQQQDYQKTDAAASTYFSNLSRYADDSQTHLDGYFKHVTDGYHTTFDGIRSDFDTVWTVKMTTGAQTYVDTMLTNFARLTAVSALIGQPFIDGAQTAGAAVNAIIAGINVVLSFLKLDTVPAWTLPGLALTHAIAGSNAPGGGVQPQAEGGVHGGPQMVLVGEASTPSHPEVVINTNSPNRQRQLQLLQRAAQGLGIGMAQGGVFASDYLADDGSLQPGLRDRYTGLDTATRQQMQDFINKGIDAVWSEALQSSSGLGAGDRGLDRVGPAIIKQVGDQAKGFASKVMDAVKNLVSVGVFHGGEVALPGQVIDWLQQAAQIALGRALSPNELGAQEYLVSRESGGDPGSVGFDPNDPGHPPVGLLQVKTYHGTMAELLDPIRNAVISYQYQLGTYGSLTQAAENEYNGAPGYAAGIGRVLNGGPAELHRGETVIPANNSAADAYTFELGPRSEAMFERALDFALSPVLRQITMQLGLGTAPDLLSGLRTVLQDVFHDHQEWLTTHGGGGGPGGTGGAGGGAGAPLTVADLPTINNPSASPLKVQPVFPLGGGQTTGAAPSAPTGAIATQKPGFTMMTEKGPLALGIGAGPGGIDPLLSYGPGSNAVGELARAIAGLASGRSGQKYTFPPTYAKAGLNEFDPGTPELGATHRQGQLLAAKPPAAGGSVTVAETGPGNPALPVSTQPNQVNAELTADNKGLLTGNQGQQVGSGPQGSGSPVPATGALFENLSQGTYTNFWGTAIAGYMEVAGAQLQQELNNLVEEQKRSLATMLNFGRVNVAGQWQPTPNGMTVIHYNTFNSPVPMNAQQITQLQRREQAISVARATTRSFT